MSNTKHTHEWSIDENQCEKRKGFGGHKVPLYDSAGACVAMVYGKNKKETIANATLMANSFGLLTSLRDCQRSLEYQINSTPSGEHRNELTDLNISALLAIKKATQ